MYRIIRWVIFLGVLGGAAYFGINQGLAYLRQRSKIQYREAPVTKGRIASVVNATGTIKPIRSISVGSFVSGPIEAIFVDFNDEVKKDDVLATVDPKIFKAAVARDQAQLATRKAEVDRVKAQLQQAKNNEARGMALRKENKSFLSDSEMDQYRFNREALEAELLVAYASVEQADANLLNSKANLEYTKILAPADGVVIDRKIDPGQTMAAQFQTPELFVVAPDMKKEMRVFASVDESDIGMIREAQQTGQPVQFTVDAYPDDLFEGKIFQIRKSSTTVQNVVTYPVIVSAPNPELKLLPGMTASISFQLRAKDDVLRIPNAALRFYPQRDQVRLEDRQILENRITATPDTEEQANKTASASEKADLRRQRNRRHVWVQDGDFLRAIEVIIGISSSNYTELVSGDLKEDHKLVTGIQPRN